MTEDLSLTVLQVLPSLETGGVERGTVEMVQAIVRAGGSALVASAGGRLVSAVERAGGTHIMLKLASKNPARIWRNAARLAFLIRAADVDIVHARSRAPAWSAWLACRRTGARFVTTWHGVYKENAPGKRRYNAIMARGERIIAISQFVATRLKARHHIDPDRLRIIPRGVDTAIFDPAAVTGERMARLAREWRLPDGLPIIMLPARLTRWKGHIVMLEAMARLERRDVGLVMVGAEQGRARFRRELIARAEALGIADRLRLVGHCDDMPAALMLADVVANPSVEPEPFGRTVIEAQAMGRPVVVSDAGGTAETVDHGVTGWRVHPSDPVGLAQAIDEILRFTPAERAALGARARASVCMHYTTAAMQQATLEVYRELVAVSRILVIKLGALGDFVLAFGPFAAIRAWHREAEITLLTTAPFAELARASPWFDVVLTDTRPRPWNLPGLLRLGRALHRFDQVYDLQTSSRSSWYFHVAGRPAWSGIAPGCSLPHANPNRDRMHTLERQRDQLEMAGITGFPAPELGWLASPAGGSPPYSVLIPGAAPHRPRKRWPAERFAALAAILARRGRPPMVVGTHADASFAATIRDACPDAVDLTGRTTLVQLANVIASARLAVGNDTGPTHLAAALGIPTLALFSDASDPALTRPRGDVTVLASADLADLTLEQVAAALP